MDRLAPRASRAPGCTRRCDTILSTPLNVDDIDQFFQSGEVACVAGVERELGGESDRGDEQIDSACSAGLPPGGGNGGENSAVGPGCIGVERDGVEGRLCSLEAVLSASPLVEIGRGVGCSGELCEGDCADGNLDGQMYWVDVIKANND